MRKPVVRQHRPDAVAPRELVSVSSDDTGAQVFAMAGRSSGIHQHPGAERVRPPAQVKVLALDQDCFVETLQRLEQVGAKQRDGAGNSKDISDRIVLFLVIFARFSQVRHQAGLVSAKANMKDAIGIVPIQEFGTHHTSVRTQRFFDESADAIRSECYVVVADQQVRPEAGVIKNRVCVLRKPLVGEQRHHGRFRNNRMDPRRHRLAARSVYDNNVERWIVLGQ